MLTACLERIEGGNLPRCSKERPMSTKIHFFCPSCKATMSAPVAAAGKKFNQGNFGQ
jgi:hypothetical protein